MIQRSKLASYEAQVINQYQGFEDRVISVMKTIPPTLDNRSCWSPEFRSILIDISSEFESVMKGQYYPHFCCGEWPPNYAGPTPEDINQCTITHHIASLECWVDLKDINYHYHCGWQLWNLVPFEKGAATPYWWKAAQKLKHNYYQSIEDADFVRDTAENIVYYHPKQALEMVRELANWVVTMQALCAFNCLIWILYSKALRASMGEGGLTMDMAQHDPTGSKLIRGSSNYQTIKTDDVLKCKTWLPYKYYLPLMFDNGYAPQFKEGVHKEPRE